MGTIALRKIDDVAVEMGRVYRKCKRELAKRDTIDTIDSYRLVMMLAALRETLQTAEIEKKVAEIEAAIARRDNNIAAFKPMLLEAK